MEKDEKKKTDLKWIARVSLVILICVAVAVSLYIKWPSETVLEFGMFTGSHWDVANANSFVIVD